MMSRHSEIRTRTALALRLGIGAVEALSPKWVVQVVYEMDPVTDRVLVVRVLGVRHLVQAALTRSGSRRARIGGAAVDGLHAASMIVLALANQNYRRAGLIEAVVALGLAASELPKPSGTEET